MEKHMQTTAPVPPAPSVDQIPAILADLGFDRIASKGTTVLYRLLMTDYKDGRLYLVKDNDTCVMYAASVAPAGKARRLFTCSTANLALMLAAI